VLMRYDPRRWSLARQVLALLTAALVAVVLTAGIAAYAQASRSTYAAARDQVLSVAEAVAASPSVVEALRGPDPSATLQPYAEQVQNSTGTDFVVIMSPEGIRYSHPDPTQIGHRFIGHIEPALHGEAFTENYTGTLGPSVRAVAPVHSAGRTVGLVAVGITLDNVSRSLTRQLPALIVAGLAAFAFAGAGAWLLSRRLRRQTHGMGPAELSRLYEFYDAVLHAVREGLLLLDRDGRLRLMNDEGGRLLGLTADAVGRPVAELPLPADLRAALLDTGERVDDVRLTADRVLVVSRMPAHWQGSELGSVVTLRDHTELLALSGELDSVRGFAESLRSQAHEAANRLHTVISLVELGHIDRALEFATAALLEAQELTDRVVEAVHEPVLAALLLGKAAEANERGVELVLAEGLLVPELGIDGRDLVTAVGNLIDNAIDAAAVAPGPRWVRVSAALEPTHDVLLVEVGDSGGGIEPADLERVFERGWSTKSGPDGGRGLGLALARQAVHRHGGQLEIVGPPGATSFQIRLPTEPTQPGQPKQSREPDQPDRPRSEQPEEVSPPSRPDGTEPATQDTPSTVRTPR
jgi:two-component system CitB family sensor kinase